MNYRHAFHAGNFADCFKHVLIARILVYLGKKDAPFRVIDTHAGLGLYDLAGDEAARTGEWREGVAKIAAASPPSSVRELLKPWLDAQHATPGTAPTTYPGSPVLAQRLTRRGDRLIFCELHAADQHTLTRNIGRDRRCKIIHIDGYVGLVAYVPPPERRGLILVDPPFEDRGEFEQMAHAVIEAHVKWPTGCYALWYPLKHPREAEAFGKNLVRAGLKRMLRLEMDVAAFAPDAPLAGCGMIVINPPFTLESEARALLPWMTNVLARDNGARWRVDWLARE